MSKYKVPPHVKIFIEGELTDYRKTKVLLKKLRAAILNSSSTNNNVYIKNNSPSNPTASKAEELVSSREIVILESRITNIENVMERLNDEEKRTVDIIFNKGHTYSYASIYDGITKDMYYYMKRKMVYLTAKEYGLI